MNRTRFAVRGGVPPGACSRGACARSVMLVLSMPVCPPKSEPGYLPGVMMLGRLEIITVLLLFFPDTYRD